jgi:peptide/nickel transport system substrate-binding protein
MTGDRVRLDGPGALTRRQALTRAGAAGATLTLGGLLAACGGGGAGKTASSASGSATGAEIDHLTWGFLGSPPKSLDIAADFNLAGVVASFQGIEGLLAIGNDLTLQPALATSWSQPDPKHYIFQLRQGVKFWDGSPFTAEDAVWSITRNMDKSVASTIAFFFGNVASVKARDDTSIVVRMSRPDPTLPAVLSFTPIYPKRRAQELGRRLGAPGQERSVIGTGPYEITSWTTESGVKLSRNESYWGKRPKVKAASITYIGEPRTLLLAAKSGSIDGAWGFPLSDAKAWAALPDHNAQFLTTGGLGLAMLTFDVESEPWSDVHVRRAVAHCCDRHGYVNAFLGGKAQPATSIVPPAQWAGVASPSEVSALYKSLPQYPFDIGQAKAELAKSKFPKGFEATTPYAPAFPQLGSALVSLSQSLKQIGITLHVKSMADNAYGSLIAAHKKLGMQMFYYLPDYPDPSDYPLVFELSAGAVPNAYNLANVKNARVDRLLAEQAATTNKAERARLLGEVLRYNAEQLPYMPLWWDGPAVALGSKYTYNGLNGMYYYQPWLQNIGVRA